MGSLRLLSGQFKNVKTILLDNHLTWHNKTEGLENLWFKLKTVLIYYHVIKISVELKNTVAKKRCQT